MFSVKDINVENKKVLVRADYNLPIDDYSIIQDDNRIKATLPLIQYLINNNAKIIIISHMGNPENNKDLKLSLKSAAKALSKLINRNVNFINDCIGEQVKQKINDLKNGDIIVLENLRFYKEEKNNDLVFAEKLASLCDIYINEAFASSHREQASITGITKFAPISVAGFLMEKEINTYNNTVENPKHPFVAVIGGVKVSSKISVLENMLQLVDKLIIGGAMANTFLKSQGVDTKSCFVENNFIDFAAQIINKAKEKGIRIVLPCDIIAAEKFDKNAAYKEVDINNIPEGWTALDIGSKTAEIYAKELESAGTIIWNGPMGVFEIEQFSSGTKKIAQAIACSNAFSIVGGGDTGYAIKKFGFADKIDYISTGGGAFIYLMQGKKLPGVMALDLCELRKKV